MWFYSLRPKRGRTIWNRKNQLDAKSCRWALFQRTIHVPHPRIWMLPRTWSWYKRNCTEWNEYESLRSHSSCELRKYRSELCFAFVYFRFSARQAAANVLAERRGVEKWAKSQNKDIYTADWCRFQRARRQEKKMPRKSVRALWCESNSSAYAGSVGRREGRPACPKYI